MLNVTDFLFWIKPCEKEEDSLSGKLGGTVGKGLVAKRQSSRLFVYMHMRKFFFEKGPCSAFLLPHKTMPGQLVQKKS